MEPEQERLVFQQLVPFEVPARILGHFLRARRERRTACSANDVFITIAGNLGVVHAESDDEDVRVKVEHMGLQQLQPLKRGISKHAEVLDFVLGVGLLLMKPRRKAARVRFVLTNRHPERPRIADTGDANRRRRMIRCCLLTAIAVGIDAHVPCVIGAEFRRHRRNEAPEQGDPILRGVDRTEDIQIRPPRVWLVLPDQCVVVLEQIQRIVPGRNWSVVVADRVRQRHVPHHRVAHEICASESDLDQQKKNDGGRQTFGQRSHEAAIVPPATIQNSGSGSFGGFERPVSAAVSRLTGGASSA